MLFASDHFEGRDSGPRHFRGWHRFELFRRRLRGAVHVSLLVLVLGLGMVLGGGQGKLGDTLVQLLALALLLSSLQLHLRGRVPIPGMTPWLLVAAVCLPPLLQLMPLPGFVHDLAPARRELAQHLQIAGVPPYRTWSLDALATERSFYWVLPGVAMFLASLQLEARWRARLLWLVLAIAIASVLLGAMQVMQGRESPLRFYALTNADAAVGFYANRNHFAGLLALVVPFVVFRMGIALGRMAPSASERQWLLVAALAGVLILLFLGVALARSRAGLLLAVLALVAAIPSVARLFGREGIKRRLLVIAGIGALIASQYAVFGLLQRLGANPLEDGRWQYAPITLEAARAHFPLGSGLGTFADAYQPFEVGKQTRVIINHAHNDYLELLLEAGLLGAAAILVVLLVFFRTVRAVWRHGESLIVQADTQAAWIGLLLLALHTAVDYPLRTTAHGVVAGLLLAIVIAAQMSALPAPTQAPAAQ